MGQCFFLFALSHLEVMPDDFDFDESMTQDGEFKYSGRCKEPLVFQTDNARRVQKKTENTTTETFEYTGSWSLETVEKFLKGLGRLALQCKMDTHYLSYLGPVSEHIFETEACRKQVRIFTKVQEKLATQDDEKKQSFWSGNADDTERAIRWIADLKKVFEVGAEDGGVQFSQE